MSPGLRPTSVPSGMLIHPAIWPQYMDRKLGEGCAPFWGRELGPHLTQCRLGQGLPPYQMASWSIQPFGLNRHGPKIEGAGPHLTQCGLGRGLPPCQVSFWSIQQFGHKTPMLQTDRQDRTGQDDDGPIAYSEPFYKRHGYLSGARCKWVVHGPADATATLIISYSCKRVR